MQRNLHEIIDDFQKAKTELERREILIKNATKPFLMFLRLAVDPNIRFTVKKIPKYKPLDMPIGMGYSNYSNEMKRVYLFLEPGSVPQRPPALTDENRERLLIQVLESLEQKEADYFVRMINKNLKVPYLTIPLLAKTFPQYFGDLAPQTQNEKQ